eukprot:5711011-Prymnesium_polylepis.1
MNQGLIRGWSMWYELYEVGGARMPHTASLSSPLPLCPPSSRHVPGAPPWRLLPDGERPPPTAPRRS